MGIRDRVWTSDERRAALPAWADYYNQERPRTALKHWGFYDRHVLWERMREDMTVFIGNALRLNDEPEYPTLGFNQYADVTIVECAFADFLDAWLREERLA